jgi:hypothetical protein
MPSNSMPVFCTDEDKANEDAAAAAMGAAWGCVLKSFGAFCPIDFYAERDGRIVGIVEFKRRAMLSTEHASVFLSFRKWIALSMGSMGLGCPAIFAVQFNDGMKYINVADAHGAPVSMGGVAAANVVTRNHIEPMLNIPIHWMHDLKGFS